MVAPDWCHFAARLPRLRDHMIAKGAVVPFEDEKFSYLAASRERVAGDGIEGRILAPPHRTKAGVTLKLCTGEGIVERFVGARDRHAAARSRRAHWGGAVKKD